MRANLSKPVITNVTFLLLLTLFTSGFFWSFYLQKENHQTIDKFYRSTNWFANRTLYLSEKFLYQANLYELNGIEFSELSQTYDLLWNRLQIFLESRSTEFLRHQHPEVTQDVQTLFNTIQSMERFFDQQQNRPKQEFTDKVNQVKENLITLNYSLSKVLSGTISQGIRSNSDLIQYWQLTGFVITMVLTLILFRLSRRSAKLAQIDPLTQLGNRRALTEHLNTLLKKNKSLTLCAIDLKRFKQFNDQIGYQVGDQVLIEFAKRLNQFKNGRAFRFGGDEFVLVLPNLAKPPSLISWVLELQQQLQFTYQFEDHQLPVAIRVGVSITDNNPQEDLDAQHLLDQAIHALNETKQSPNKDYAFYCDAIERIQSNKTKIDALNYWLTQSEAVCPLDVQTTSLHQPNSNTGDVMEVHFVWKKDNTLCSIEWLTEQHLDLKILPKLLSMAAQRQPQPIMIRLQSCYQLKLLLKAAPQSLIKQEIVFGLPMLIDVEESLIKLIKVLDVKIGLEKVIADHLIEPQVVDNVKYWIPTNLPNTEAKQNALFELATAFNKTTLLPMTNNPTA